jgi:hypothetical protein
MGPGRKNGCSGIRERHLGPFRCYSHHLYFEFLDRPLSLILANHRLNSRAKEMSDARLCYCTPSHCRMPHAASSRATSPAAAARREPCRCHLIATLRTEEEPSYRCRRPPQPSAPPHVARAASRRHRPSAAPRAVPPLFCCRTVPLPWPAAPPPRRGVGRSRGGGGR